MTIALLIIAMAIAVIAFAVSFTFGLYVGRLTIKPYKPDALPEPNEAQKRAAERYQRDLDAIMSYTGSPKD